MDTKPQYLSREISLAISLEISRHTLEKNLAILGRTSAHSGWKLLLVNMIFSREERSSSRDIISKRRDLVQGDRDISLEKSHNTPKRDLTIIPREISYRPEEVSLEYDTIFRDNLEYDDLDSERY